MRKALQLRSSSRSRDVEKVYAVVARSTFLSKKRHKKKDTMLRRRNEAHFQVTHKTHQRRNTFGTWDVEKVHAGVARSHISKSKVSKTDGPRPPLKVEMSKKMHAVVAFRVKMLKTLHARTTFWRADVEKSCTLLWREAHFQFRMHKAPDVRTTFDGWDVVLRGRRKGFCTLSKVSKRWKSCSSFNYNYNYNTLHCSRLHYTTLHYTTLHPTTLHYIALHYTTVHYTTLQYTTLHNTPPHYTTLDYTT